MDIGGGWPDLETSSESDRSSIDILDIKPEPVSPDRLAIDKFLIEAFARLEDPADEEEELTRQWGHQRTNLALPGVLQRVQLALCKSEDCGVNILAVKNAWLTGLAFTAKFYMIMPSPTCCELLGRGDREFSRSWRLRLRDRNGGRSLERDF